MKEENRIKQFRFENEAAQRLLQFLLQENAILKTRLAGALDEMNDAQELLIIAEQYQDWLIQNDSELCYFKELVQEQDKMMVRYLHEDGPVKLIVCNQKQLRKDLRKMNETFGDLKIQFNAFLESVA